MWNNHFAAHFCYHSPKSSSKSSTWIKSPFFQYYQRRLLSCRNLSSASINRVSTLPAAAAVATSLKLSLPKPCDFAWW
jgi:hypothetical protein